MTFLTVTLLTGVSSLLFFRTILPMFNFELAILLAGIAAIVYLQATTMASTVGVAIGIAIAYALSAFVWPFVEYIYDMITNNDDNVYSPGFSPGSTTSQEDHDTCQTKCGENSVCYAACLENCEYSYCVEYGKRTKLDQNNCATHSRRFKASSLSREPGAILCRQWHRHHPACITCDNPQGCVQTTDCSVSVKEDIEKTVEEMRKSSDTTEDYHLSESELVERFSRHRISSVY